MKTLRFLTLLIIFLAACATTPTATPPPPTQAATAIVSLPTSTNTALPTAAPSSTPTLLPPTATAEPTAIPATSTPDAQTQLRLSVEPLVGTCRWVDGPLAYSPNGTWVLATCLSDQSGEGTVTKFARANGKQQWNLSFNEVFLRPYRAGDANLSMLLQKFFIPVRWTKNEDFVYLAAPSADENTPFKGYAGLFRLDLATGKTRPVLKPSAAPLSATYALQFSPLGNKLAYINQAVTPVAIHIVDTSSGEESQITLDARFTQGGSLLWSADEKQLVVSVLDEGKNGGNAVVLYDLATLENRYILQQSATTYLPFDWKGTNTLYAESYPGSWVYIDLMTGVTSPAPAPTPAP